MQLLTTKTFFFINRSEAVKDPITGRWVFRTKRDSRGEVIKLKARLVVQGFQQVPGIDFTETYASTSTPLTWRIILAWAAMEDLEAKQINFIGAFLNSDPNTDIYIKLPKGLLEFARSSPQARDLLKRFS